MGGGDAECRLSLPPVEPLTHSGWVAASQPIACRQSEQIPCALAGAQGSHPLGFSAPKNDALWQCNLLQGLCQAFDFDYFGQAHHGEKRLSPTSGGATQEHFERIGRVAPTWVPSWLMELGTIEQRSDPNPDRSLALDVAE